MNGVQYVERTRNGNVRRFSSMDRLGADVRSIVSFGASHGGRPNLRCLGQRYISAGLSGLVGETRVVSRGWRRITGTQAILLRSVFAV